MYLEAGSTFMSWLMALVLVVSNSEAIHADTHARIPLVSTWGHKAPSDSTVRSLPDPAFDAERMMPAEAQDAAYQAAARNISKPQPPHTCGSHCIIAHDRNGEHCMAMGMALSQLSPEESNYVPGKPGLLPSTEEDTKNFSDYLRTPHPFEYPASTAVKIQAAYPITNNQLIDRGSGVLIDASHVLTGGHCLYHTEAQEWPTQVVVKPAYDDNSFPYGAAGALTVYISNGWINDQDPNSDFGIVYLNRPVGFLAGWLGYGFNNNCSFYTDGNLFVNRGYPQDGPGFNGNLMYDRIGTFDGCGLYGDETLFWRNVAYGGSSGSGTYWTTNRVVYSITTHGIDPKAKYAFNGDTRIGQERFYQVRDNIIAEHCPSTPNLIPLGMERSPFVIPKGNQLQHLAYVVGNYSTASWSGQVDVAVYLSQGEYITTNDILIQQHSFSHVFQPLSSVVVEVTEPPVIPLSVPGGYYHIGVILLAGGHGPASAIGPGDLYNAGIHIQPYVAMTPSSVSLCGLDPGESFQTIVTVKNVGNIYAWYNATCDNPCITSISPDHGSFFPGEEEQLTIYGVAPASSGTYNATVVVNDAFAGTAVSNIAVDVGYDAIAPVLVSPVNNSDCEPLYGYLTWEPVANAVEYEVRLPFNGDCDYPGFVQAFTNEPKYAYPSPGYGATLVWKVRARTGSSECWSGWSECRRFSVRDAPLPVPFPMLPFDNSIVNSSVTLVYGGAGSSVYEVQVGSTCGYGRIVQSAGTSVTISDLTPNAQYAWRVRVRDPICGNAWSDWSTCFHFSTQGEAEWTLVNPSVWGEPSVFGASPSSAWTYLRLVPDTYADAALLLVAPAPQGIESFYCQQQDSTGTSYFDVCWDVPRPVLPPEIVQASWADYDNDGDWDLYVVNRNRANQMLKRDRYGGFAEVMIPNLSVSGPGCCAAWADYDNDGFLDVYLVQEYAGNHLLRNIAGADFDDNTDYVMADVAVHDNCKSASWCDYNNDGNRDLFVPAYSDSGRNRLFANNGDGTFSDASSLLPVSTHGYASAGAWGDYNNDGWFDLLVVRSGPGGEASVLLRNTQGTAFVDVTATSFPAGDDYRLASAAWFDCDNDTHLDIACIRYGGPNQLLINGGDGTFTDRSSIPVAYVGSSADITTNDYDLDGDVDLFVSVSGSSNSRLLRNELSWDRQQVGFRLVGLGGLPYGTNRDGIGARISVNVGGVSVNREVDLSNAYLGQNGPIVWCGLGVSWSSVNNVRITWPSGRTAVYDRTQMTRPVTFLYESDAITHVNDRTNDAALQVLEVVPNPFNASVHIGLLVPTEGILQVAVYNVQGRLVKQVLNTSVAAGRVTVDWDGKDSAGQQAASGTYFCRIRATDGSQSVKLLMVK
ncbi:MAG: T9SS C-terminal target domain-containing protein [Dehalococcoidia bacterium]|nr:MAG: T9SS C-terminal target domain-containing protein [Dehalococcoidia bacterium]